MMEIKYAVSGTFFFLYLFRLKLSRKFGSYFPFIHIQKNEVNDESNGPVTPHGVQIYLEQCSWLHIELIEAYSMMIVEMINANILELLLLSIWHWYWTKDLLKVILKDSLPIHFFRIVLLIASNFNQQEWLRENLTVDRKQEKMLNGLTKWLCYS